MDIETLVRQRIAAESQDSIAAKAGMKACTVSRILSGNQGIPLDKLGDFLAALGVELPTPDEGQHIRVSREKYQALQLLAREALQRGDE